MRLATFLGNPRRVPEPSRDEAPASEARLRLHTTFSRRRRLVSLAAALVLPVLAARAARADDDDPAKGKFTLEEATKGLSGPASAPLTAKIETTEGTFTCQLFDKQAPVTVANFVGLARGLRPWKDPKTNQWVKKPFYDGLIFHRVIPGFMIQGGDPLGTGTGNPGYRFEDEFSPDLKFDKPGLLAMANAGPGTNGSQFFITEGMPAHLTGRHTIFGECEPLSLVTKITSVQRGPRDRPVKDVVIKKVTISRGKGGKSKAKETKATDK
jgi:peptidyl-prolyl cis-trans isomerase A (cyclophilin A)